MLSENAHTIEDGEEVVLRAVPDPRIGSIAWGQLLTNTIALLRATGAEIDDSLAGRSSDEYPFRIKMSASVRRLLAAAEIDFAAGWASPRLA